MATAWKSPGATRVHSTIADSPHGVACRPEDAFSDATWWNRLRFEASTIRSLWPVPEPEVGDHIRLAPSFKPHDIPPGYSMSLVRLAGCVRPPPPSGAMPGSCHGIAPPLGMREAKRVRTRVARLSPMKSPWERVPLEQRELEKRRAEIERRGRRGLEQRLKPAMIAVMAWPDFVIRAIDPGNNEVVIPGRLAPQLVPDVLASRASQGDGSITWRGLTVERSAVPEGASERPRPPAESWRRMKKFSTGSRSSLFVSLPKGGSFGAPTSPQHAAGVLQGAVAAKSK